MVAIGTVTGQEIRKNRDGAANVRLLQVQLSNASDIQTVQYLPMAGDDSPPQIGDLVVVVPIGPAFMVALGVQDSVVPTMSAGERKIYSRDGSGDIAAFINLLAGGDLELNGNANTAVRFTPLDTALQALVIAINAALATKADASGTAGALTLDISGAESSTVKLI
ncbi:MAG: hypothetical protein V3T82_07170 [Nitrospinaceae bacterium]